MGANTSNTYNTYVAGPVTSPNTTSTIKTHVLRLLPNSDIYLDLLSYLKTNKINAAFIQTCVGSLSKIHIRTANSVDFIKKEENFEILSLVGCISIERCHLHVSLGDGKGNVIGGHLLKEGNIVNTTAELVIGELVGLKFESKKCEKSGWSELVVKQE